MTTLFFQQYYRPPLSINNFAQVKMSAIAFVIKSGLRDCMICYPFSAGFVFDHRIMTGSNYVGILL